MVDLEVRDCRHGKGVFAARGFAAGEAIREFKAPLAREADLPAGNRMSLQVGPDLFMLPSGTLGDYFNHSCDPNAAVRYGDRVVLAALRTIAADEEIRFDYSIGIDGPSFSMNCSCGAAACRGIVVQFRALAEDVRRRYLLLGLVPAYVQDRP